MKVESLVIDISSDEEAHFKKDATLTASEKLKKVEMDMALLQRMIRIKEASHTQSNNPITNANRVDNTNRVDTNLTSNLNNNSNPTINSTNNPIHTDASTKSTLPCITEPLKALLKAHDAHSARIKELQALVELEKQRMLEVEQKIENEKLKVGWWVVDKK